MAWRSHSDSNAGLVGALTKHGILHSDRARAALLAADRADFVLDPADAYFDTPQPIGYGATISAPHMHAYALELMADKLVPGAKVLDVGSGSGILCVAFAHMVRPGGKVVGIDHIPELVAWSEQNIRKHHGAFLDDGTIVVKTVDGFKGCPEYGPYDAIHVGAAAPEVPQALLDQLAPGGRMILPVGKWSQDLVQVDKDASGHVHKKHLMGVMYVPLTTPERQKGRHMF